MSKVQCVGAVALKGVTSDHNNENQKQTHILWPKLLFFFFGTRVSESNMGKRVHLDTVYDTLAYL